jgi:hypothetical protein
MLDCHTASKQVVQASATITIMEKPVVDQPSLIDIQRTVGIQQQPVFLPSMQPVTVRTIFSPVRKYFTRVKV